MKQFDVDKTLAHMEGHLAKRFDEQIELLSKVNVVWLKTALPAHVGKHGATTLMAAALVQGNESLEKVLSDEATMSIFGLKAVRPLDEYAAKPMWFYALKGNNAGAVRRFLVHMESLDEPKYKHLTPLLWAIFCAEDNADVVEAILELGADPNKRVLLRDGAAKPILPLDFVMLCLSEHSESTTKQIVDALREKGAKSEMAEERLGASSNSE